MHASRQLSISLSAVPHITAACSRSELTSGILDMLRLRATDIPTVADSIALAS